jgi:hypothetical protein
MFDPELAVESANSSYEAIRSPKYNNLIINNIQTGWAGRGFLERVEISQSGK